jgi:peptidoglycan hydrolase CwlO-like protein
LFFEFWDFLYFQLIKEQKTRLQDLVKNRNELNENIKKQDSKIVELTNKESKSTESIGNLKKEKSELAVRIQALECLLDGLRQEKKLWSQELAQQGR